MTHSIDPHYYREVLGAYPTGVCVVAASLADGRRVGMAVGSFTSVSLDPPLVAFFPAKTSTSWPEIQKAERFCINVLADDQEWLCRKFAARGDDKFAGVAHDLEHGAPRIDGAVAWIGCDLEAVHDAGDHVIVVSRVLSLETRDAGQPLIFLRGRYGQFNPGENLDQRSAS
ncbi:Flavin-dependent monooxygenase, reductase subunit HsaB [compost metagenome]